MTLPKVGGQSADNDGFDAAMSDTTAASPIRCELLCFVQQKSSVLAYNHLVKICCDFFKKDEIISARVILDNLTSKRLPKRVGADTAKATMEDIIKTCLDSNQPLPIFYAVDLSRLPPVDVEHCDVSVILKELQGLRREIREVHQLKEEIEVLKIQIAELSILKSDMSELKSVTNNLRSKQDEIIPSLLSLNPNSQVRGTDLSTTARNSQGSYAAAASREASNHGPVNTITLRDTAVKHRKSLKSVVGSSVSNSRLKTVATHRKIDLFVSRLHPLTSDNELYECVNNILLSNKEFNHDLKFDDLVCSRLKCRYEGLYCSYHVSVRVDAVCMQYALDVLSAPEVWPAGVLVRRYFPPKNCSQQ